MNRSRFSHFVRLCTGWMVPLGACLTVLGCCVPAAQAQDVFADRLEAAAMADDEESLTELVEERRLDVKPAVTMLVTESLRADVSRDSSRAEAKRAAAVRIAATFEERFGETSLSEAAGYLSRWTPEEKRAKLRADSLLAFGRELRSGEEALHAYEAALADYRAIGDRLGEAEVLGGLGVVYWYAGEGDSTLAYFQFALEARRAVDDRQLVGNSLNDLGSASRAFFGDHRQAAEYYMQAAAVREEIGASADLARTYSYAALCYDFLGQPTRSLELYGQAIQIAEALERRDLELTALHNSGVVLKNLGRHSESVDRFERAARLARDAGDVEAIVDALNMAGESYRRLGDFDAAVAKYQDVIDISTTSDHEGGLADAHLNLGAALDHAGRPERAESYFSTALELYRAQADTMGELLALTGISNTRLSMDDYAAASDRAEEVVRIARQMGNRPEISRALSTLANAQVHRAQGERALRNYKEALKIASELENPELIWIALMGFGEYYERVDDYPEAIRFYDEAVATTERVRQTLQTAEDRSGYVSQIRYVYENMIHLLSLLAEKHPEENYDLKAFELLERAKARSFLDILSEGRFDLRSNVDPQLLSRQDSLVARIGDIQRQIQQMAAGDLQRQVLDSLRATRAELEDEYRFLGREIRLQSPVYASIRYPEPSDLEEVQQHLLNEDAVLLQYAVGDSSSTLWAVTREAARMYRLPNREELREQVEILRFSLSTAQSTPANFSTPARRLYELLISPAEDVIGERKQIIVVPDDVLHYLPFEVLLTEEDPGSSFAELPYLIRRSSLTYGPSASVLIERKNSRDDHPKHYSKQFLGFGDPEFGRPEDTDITPLALASETVRAGLADLPYSRVEVESIGELFGTGGRDVFLGESASEEIVKSSGLLSEYRFVHFATHGIVDEERPDFSGLVFTLTGDSSEDGFLQAAEIFGLSLRPELVVLSACDTGLGKLVRGEGVVGLTRAFMYAGAPSLVVSLWRVADKSTSVLMRQFYAEMISGRQLKADALQRAKLSLLSEDTFAHPFYWAPFIMVGDNG